ncbi:hypothetical protein [Streptomyces sp. NPDC047071]|uniref:hypothetical protein n=1 Tax=Streptomyces sp. NPDC047071 TaxID=3154808 RepID=UPI003454F5E4
MDTPDYAGLLAMLRSAESHAWDAVLTLDREKATQAHDHVRAALTAIEALGAGQPCAGPQCGATLAYAGTGRPARYCSRRCRDRAAYRARRQR